MLKIWLTWLQPSLGVFGTALVLSSPLFANAAPKPVVVSNINKTPAHSSQWSHVKSADRSIEQELANGIAGTPDLAIRQLAISSMGANVVAQSTSSTIKTPKSNRNPLASFVAPSARLPQLSAKGIKPRQGGHSLALARLNKPKITVPVPGLFIGTADVRVSNKFLPNVKPISQSIASTTEIGAPTPLSAMMAAKTAVDPFPVVRPELMQKLQGISTASAVQAAPHALNPIAAIPSNRNKVVAPKTISVKAVVPQSLDPIAAIPSGLQRLLGNNLNSQPTVAAVPLAKTIAPKPGSLLALQYLTSPTVTPVSVSAASLQLATSQAYTSVPKFSIPGETLLAGRAMKPVVNLVAIKRVQKNLVTTVAERKDNYVAIMNDRHLTPASKSWTVVDQRNTLGGLILGSQPLATVTRVVNLTPTSTVKAHTSGLAGRNLADFN